MNRLFIFFFIISLGIKSQDKLFFKNGAVKKGLVVSVTNDNVLFKNSDTSLTIIQIPKTELLLRENYKGDVSIFSNTKLNKEANKINETHYERNILGWQPYSLASARLTFLYERLTKNNKIGFVIPLILSFNVLNNAFDSLNNQKKSARNISMMSGVDVNFYIGKGVRSKFFIGPRLRFGTDLLLGVDGYTLQTQFGWRFGKPGSTFVRHLSFGFGFVNVLSSANSTGINAKQVYGWYSVNYRRSIKW